MSDHIADYLRQDGDPGFSQEDAERYSDVIDLDSRRPKASPSPAAIAEALDGPYSVSTLGNGLPPTRNWLVADWIPSGVVTGLYGAGGTGKTLLTMLLQTASYLGKPWLGLPVTRGSSLGLYCEDDKEELWRRQTAINSLYGCSMDKMAGVHHWARVANDNLLMTFGANGVGQTTKLYDRLTEACLDLKVKTVVIDGAADTFGGNENDRGQVKQFVGHALGKLAVKIHGQVILCAHPSRSGLSSGSGDSGSTGWSNAFRSRLYLNRPDEDEGNVEGNVDDRFLSRKKANYARQGDVRTLRWQRGVIVPADQADGATPYVAKSSRPAEDVFLALLDERNEQDRPVSYKVKAGNYAPTAFMEFKAEHRDFLNKKVLKGAMESLFQKGLIKLELYGRPSDGTKKIVRATVGDGPATERDG